MTPLDTRLKKTMDFTMISFFCEDCKAEVKHLLDERGCFKCKGKRISKKEFETNKEWLKWWSTVGSKDRNAYYEDK